MNDRPSLDAGKGIRMARFNAASELARFWIEVRHGFLVTESMPVAVPYGLSDIDILAMHPSGGTITLPNGHAVGPRVRQGIEEGPGAHGR